MRLTIGFVTVILAALLLSGAALAEVSVTVHGGEETTYTAEADWWYGEDANDRGGYRVFIPRGRQYPPEYYGSGGRGPVRTTPRWRPRYRRHHDWDGYGYSGNQYVVVGADDFYFSYGRSRSPYDYGYYGNSYAYPPGSTIVIDGRPVSANPPPPLGYDYGYEPGYDFSLPPASSGTTYNDYSETSNYYGDVYNGPAVPPAQYAPRPQPDLTPAPEPAIQVTAPTGGRFSEAARIAAPDGVLAVRLDDGQLWIGPADGEALLVAEDADEDFGGFASYSPDAGPSVIFKRAGKLAVATLAAGSWKVLPLPYEVDFGKEVNLGLVGGQPWATITATSGTRYVMAVTAAGWTEIGSGTIEKPRPKARQIRPRGR